jgi:hypothetical protein
MKCFTGGSKPNARADIVLHRLPGFNGPTGSQEVLVRKWGISAGFDAPCCHRVAPHQIVQNPRDVKGTLSVYP